MLELFNKPWKTVPTVWIDTETTGLSAFHDSAVQVGFARFENGACVAQQTQLVDPGRPIPIEATAIHGITAVMVTDAMFIADLFGCANILSLLRGAQPAAYNAPFDKQFVPPFLDDWSWPWLDGLTWVRECDRYVRGAGRHKLAAACARHSIPLPQAHDAGADAKAAGQLFYALAGQVTALIAKRTNRQTLGELLREQRLCEAVRWFEFQKWLGSRPKHQQNELPFQPAIPGFTEDPG